LVTLASEEVYFPLFACKILLFESMIEVSTRKSIQEVIQSWKSKGLTVGFVPTMGALHPGHISLVEQAKKACDKVVVSVFVNPLQFNRAEDLAQYPIQIESDRILLDSNGCDVLYIPSFSEVFEGADPTSPEPGELGMHGEGAFRPGHFKGVLRVVYCLFLQIRPNKGFFGLKDYQQYLLIQKMAAQFFPEMEIVGCPTLREPDGIPMSSRNLKLSEAERVSASEVCRRLKNMAETANPSLFAKQIQEWPLRVAEIPNIHHEYIALSHAQTLAPLAMPITHADSYLSIAFFSGKVRLIDGYLLSTPPLN
jgi:pantoate--beta-alanine ligase